MKPYGYSLLYSVATEFLEIFSNETQKEYLWDHRVQLEATEQVPNTGWKLNSQTRHEDN